MGDSISAEELAALGMFDKACEGDQPPSDLENQGIPESKKTDKVLTQADIDAMLANLG